MWAAVLALGGLLSVATAQGPEFDLQKFKETYVRDGAVCHLAPYAAAGLLQGDLDCLCPSVSESFHLSWRRAARVVAGLTHPRDNPKHDPTHEVSPIPRSWILARQMIAHETRT